MKKIAILGGGTIFHVRPHLALSAPAYGKTALYQVTVTHFDDTETYRRFKCPECGVITDADVPWTIDIQTKQEWEKKQFTPCGAYGCKKPKQKNHLLCVECQEDYNRDPDAYK